MAAICQLLFLVHAGILLTLLSIGTTHAVNGVPKSELFPYGPENGDSATSTALDAVSGPIPLQFPFAFFNSTYSSLWVSTNGLVSFRQRIAQYSPTCGALGPQSTMIAPYWADSDLRIGGQVYYRETNNLTLRAKAVTEIRRAFPQLLAVGSASLFIATWDNIAFYQAACGSKNESGNTFQLVLSTDGVYSFSLLYYNDIVWTTGTDSGGNCTGLGGQPAKAGFDVGDGQTFYELPGTCTDDILHIAGSSNMGEPGKWIFRVDNTLQNSSCNDDTTPKLQISPSFVSAYGHEPLSILGPCLDETLLDEDVFCEFHDPLGPPAQRIPAWLDRNESLVICPAPFLYTLGRMELDVIVTRRGAGDNGDDREDVYSGYVYVVQPHPDIEAEFTQVGPEDSDIVSVQLSWDPQLYPDDSVLELEVSMWEISPENTWRLVAVLGNVSPPELSTGRFSKDVDTSELADSMAIFQLSPIRLVEEDKRIPIIPIFLLLRRAYTIAKWVYRFNKVRNALSCDRWYNSDSGVPSDIEPCPCLFRQAERDPRFKREESWSDFTPPGADVGFHQREASASGAGQQCTYNAGGNLITNGPAAGSAFKHSPSSVLGFIRHLNNDVRPRLICSVFTDKLDKYFQKRPTDNCGRYREPGLGGGVGDPHITTLDGTTYTFNGAGEFWMIQSSDFAMQARMEVLADKSSIFTAFALHDAETKVQIELSPIGGLDIRLDDELVSFVDGEAAAVQVSRFIPGKSASISMSPASVTVSFHLGFTFTFTLVESSFSILALADETRLGKTNGLLGHFDRNPDNDLRTPDGTLVPFNSTLSVLHYEFGLKWMVRSADESLFVYSRGSTFDSYAKPDFEPSFDLPDLNEIPEHVLAICAGSIPCLFDYVATGSLSFANATREQGQLFNETLESFQEKIHLCPPITVLENGYVNYTTNFVNGSKIQFGCNEGYELEGPHELSCGFTPGSGGGGDQTAPVWNGAPPTCNKLDENGNGGQKLEVNQIGYLLVIIAASVISGAVSFI